MANLIRADNGVTSGISGVVTIGDSSGQLALQTVTSGGSPVTALTIDNSQKVTFANSIGFGSNAGITFNNSSASTNSLLNDYETGTWTPTWTAAAGSMTYTSAGSYTKIGNIVYIFGYVSISSASGASGLNLAGLPFNTVNSYTTPQVGVARENSATGKMGQLFLAVNASTGVIQDYTGSNLSLIHI